MSVDVEYLRRVLCEANGHTHGEAGETHCFLLHLAKRLQAAGRSNVELEERPHQKPREAR